MPEHTLPDALHPQQEDAADELQLRGGLKGRFFADFCLLQSTVDALQNYLVHAAPLMYRIWQHRCWKR